VSIAPLRAKAHGRSIRASLPEVVQTLVDALGTGLVAVLTETHVSGVRKWAKGGRLPEADKERQLREAHRIVLEFRHRGESDSTIRAWFGGMNPELGDEAPALVMRHDPKRVLDAAHAFIDHG
jgi:hypothetical protein